MIGERYERLIVTATAAHRCNKARVAVKCDCGTEKIVYLSDLRHGKVKSCGCLNNEMRLRRNTKHSFSQRGKTDRLYWVWQSMLRRCLNPKNRDWHLYGGRGITVCEAWRHSFETFLRDMGPRPTPHHQIDRVNNDGNYEPSNCRWATSSENCRNRRARTTHPQTRKEGVSE